MIDAINSRVNFEKSMTNFLYIYDNIWIFQIYLNYTITKEKFRPNFLLNL